MLQVKIVYRESFRGRNVLKGKNKISCESFLADGKKEENVSMRQELKRKAGEKMINRRHRETQTVLQIDIQTEKEEYSSEQKLGREKVNTKM